MFAKRLGSPAKEEAAHHLDESCLVEEVVVAGAEEGAVEERGNLQKEHDLCGRYTFLNIQARVTISCLLTAMPVPNMMISRTKFADLEQPFTMKIMFTYSVYFSF